VTPDQAIALLSVAEWPPKVDVQWPRRVNRKQGEGWPVGMLLQGIIEARFNLRHSANTPGDKKNEPYPALYLRRLRMVDGNREWGPDGARVLFHGMHTVVEEDLPTMMPLPGLMLTAVFRGYEGPNEFVNIKCLVTTYGGPILPWMDEALRAQVERPRQQPPSQQARQAGGRPTEAPPRQAPEGGVGASASPSGSNLRVKSVAEARAYVQAQPSAWRQRFTEILGDARTNGRVGERLSLEEIQRLIVLTHNAVARDAAA
jgi:hypothetical protein